MSANGLIRWYVDQRARHAEDAILARRLVSTIDAAYPNISEAEPRIATARDRLVQQADDNAFALDEVRREEWEALGLQLFAHNPEDRTTEMTRLNSAMRHDLARARRRAEAFDTVRFLHLLEARSATTLAGGAELSEEVSVDTISS